MLDVKFIYENRELVKSAIQNKGEKRADVDVICSLYDRKKELQFRTDNLRQELNASSKDVAKIKRAGGEDKQLIEKNRRIGNEIKTLEEETRTIEAQLAGLLAWVPNVPAADVPIGRDASDNKNVKQCGEHRNFSFPPKPHWDIAAELDIIDFERAPKLSGSNFLLFKGAGARLERALINFMLDLHTKKHGYTEISPPYLAGRQAMFGTGQLPKLEEDMYHLKDDDLFLIPTAEVPVTNIHSGEVLKYDELPKYYTAYTACFRREAGAYGKDTRGLLRVHQFDKVELVKFVHPDTSFDEIEKLLANAEEVLQLLELEYRVVMLSTGDMSFASAKTYDIDAFAPGVDKWLEVSSCSNFTDFQARRMNCRFRDKDGKVKFVHTLNGSGIALPRTVIALLENYQQADGSVGVPKVLQPYMDGLEVIKK
ncbi:MAG: serine--tRNA ligase [Planctomycetes bacterium RBG_16_43_13]|nr:MAG: serine--tRNA ligase [Planctomycetes bacterium RBG_16_43_13]